MDSGEPSGLKRKRQEQLENDLWAKLVPSDLSYPEVEIRSNDTTVCSSIMCSSTEKLNWCSITKAAEKATIRNISANIIYVNNAPLGLGESVNIQFGSQVVAGSLDEDYISYIFRAISAKKEDDNLCEISLDIDHVTCGICLSAWDDVVTASPCLHNFCNGCLSEWTKRSPKKNCPQCRTKISSVRKNPFLQLVSEKVIQKKKKRFLSFDDNENDTQQVPCLQCGTEFGGFRCNHTTAHLKCEACSEMMPLRPDISVPQNCVGCDKPFCCAYWLAQGVMPSADTPICGSETFCRVRERILSKIPSSAHEGNEYEITITESCISRLGKPLHGVISELIVKLNNGELDLSGMPLNHAELINGDTFLCNKCYDKLVGYLLYWFRITAPNHLLPVEASERDDCWYGYSCRTQRKAEHARSRNHVCRPTRGSTYRPTRGST